MPDVVLACLIAFASGTFYELSCVFWVHNSEQGRPGKTAMWSMLLATCEVAGIGGSVKYHIAAPFFVIGYGLGSYLGVRFAKRKIKVST